MANATDVRARHVHGTDPQFLIETIIRNKIYDSPYWKEHCFGLNAVTLLDKAVLLDHIGGMYGGHVLPTPFLCLVLKLLQIQPDQEIIRELIRNQDHKYVRVLAAFYFRLVAHAVDIYTVLEPVLTDYRKIRQRSKDGGWMITHVDEVIEHLLYDDIYLDIALPRMMKRHVLEQTGKISKRHSQLINIIKQEQQQQPTHTEEHIETTTDNGDTHTTGIHTATADSLRHNHTQAGPRTATDTSPMEKQQSHQLLSAQQPHASPPDEQLQHQQPGPPERTIKEPERERTNHRHRSEDKDKDKHRQRDRGRDADRDSRNKHRHKDRHRGRERHKDRKDEHSRDHDRDRDRSRERHRHRHERSVDSRRARSPRRHSHRSRSPSSSSSVSSSASSRSPDYRRKRRR